MALPPISTLAEPVTCFPAWHTVYKKYGGQNLGTVSSGCSIVNGNVNCDPVAMAQHASEKFGNEVTLEAYTLARYFASEVGSGTVEEKIAVAQAAQNRARYVEHLPNGILDLLLYRQPQGNPHRGFYGPINVVPSTGRWASTSKDPTYADLILAIALLDGTFDGFNKGADDQDGLEYTQYFPNPAATVVDHAQRGKYWVGPLPGVDHWKTFLWRSAPEIAFASPEGQWLLARALDAVKDRKKRPSWLWLPVCGTSPWQKPAIAGASFLGAGLLAFTVLGFVRRRARMLGGRPDDWWKRAGSRERQRHCYRTKTSMLQAFRDTNRETIERWGGLDAKSGEAEFDALNHKYSLRGRKAVKTLARALWVASPKKPPYCLDEIDVRALNETSPGQHGRGFILPSWARGRSAESDEERFYTDKQDDERRRQMRRAIDEAFDKALMKRGMKVEDVPF